MNTRSLTLATLLVLAAARSGSAFFLQSTDLGAGPAKDKCGYDNSTDSPDLDSDTSKCRRMNNWVKLFVGSLTLTTSGGRSNTAGYQGVLQTVESPPITTSSNWTYNFKFGYLNKPILREVLEAAADYLPKDTPKSIWRKSDDITYRKWWDDFLIDAVVLNADGAYGYTLKEDPTTHLAKIDQNTTYYEASIAYQVPFDRVVGDLLYGRGRWARQAPPTSRDYWSIEPAK